MSPRQHLPYEPADPLLAAATWSRLVEPGDHAAAALVAALGAGGALEWFLEEAIDEHGQVRPHAHPPMALDADPARAQKLWVEAAWRWAPRLPHLDIRRELDWLARLGGTLILPGDLLWPVGLDELAQPPMCLWLRGDPSLLGHLGVSEQECSRRPLGRAIALVGSRASTRYGDQVAFTLAEEVAAAGVIVVSGGAYGIDAAAHRGALAGGKTISVSAGGVDRLYPAGNAALLERVINEGALVAEVPPGGQPGRHRFLSRNRLIAAMTGATIVVEAAWRSGALSTARHARDLGRDLGAVPGPVTSMESVGCHRLLREGATCITSATEALELITPLGSPLPLGGESSGGTAQGQPTGNLLDGLGEEQSRVLDAMPARHSATVEAIAGAAGLSIESVAASLGFLELAGRVARDRGRWKRVAPGAARGR